MRQDDIIHLVIMDLTWFILLIEHTIFDMELALPLAIIWGILAMLLNIKIIAQYAVSICKAI
jgi:hypothetical protein